MSDSTVTILRDFAYLLAAILFIRGLKGLTHPRTAVRGNLLGSSAMLIAVVATLLKAGIVGWVWIFSGMLVGGLIGAVLGLKIQMTAMPQLVALFNGFGGGASVLVAGSALVAAMAALGGAAMAGEEAGLQMRVATVFSAVIGSTLASPLMPSVPNSVRVITIWPVNRIPRSIQRCVGLNRIKVKAWDDRVRSVRRPDSPR